jgi:hypothetical protein
MKNVTSQQICRNNDRDLLDICPKGGPPDAVRVKVKLVIDDVSEVL